MNKFAGLLGVLALAIAAPLARADFEISVNGTDCVLTASASPNGTVVCSTVNVAPGVSISVLSLTGTQTPTFSQELGSTLLISNTTGSNVTFNINLAVSNFSSPTTPPSIMDASGLTLNPTTGKGSVSLVSCVDQSNGLVPPSGTFCSSPAPGQAPPNPALSFNGPGTTSNTTFGTITSLHAPFSLTQELTITADAGSNFNVTASQVLTPVPEPAAVLLLGTAILGVTRIVRKKVAKRS